MSLELEAEGVLLYGGRTRILAGGERGDHLDLEAVGWADEDAEDPIGAALISTHVHVVAGPFRGRLVTELRREDLVSWRSELAAIDTDFRPGEARYKPSLGDALEFAVVIGNTGSLMLRGWLAQYQGASDQRLEFSFPIEQSVRELLLQTDRILRWYPARSSD